MNEQLKALLKEADISVGTNQTDKQKDVIRAALELFAEKGYAGTTTQAIAQKARVSEKTLFKHFESKEKLFRQTVYPAMIQVLAPLLIEQTEKIIEKEKNRHYRDVLYDVYKDRIDFAIENPDVIKLILQELLFSPDLRGVMANILQQQMAPLISQVLPPTDDGEPDYSLIRVILSLLVGYISTRTILAPDQAWDDEKEIQFMLDVLFYGLERRQNSQD
ncbi:TetR/AcrR family transcriptional regulator [Desmospora profundinema]|uniref:AcrR family transcriptional regulator n=1 Tax=Desmospora profundinema TaxID=1571184 RepID=A0ABU1IJK6_9BACL|nr:TetR/AcrR family transcriptional regulator [Desmospora profundinema]MDR6224933.1 AcrR family transcriptional regulator [Desmospora profundinema]